MKMKLKIEILLAFGFTVISINANAVPSSINAPISGSGWSYNQHNPGGFYEGINGTNDGYSWDINYGSRWDDDGLPVYAVEAGDIHTTNSWDPTKQGVGDYGQILINHDTNGDKWSSGYLHMKNIVKRSGHVSKGDTIGYISRTGYLLNSNITSPHLHFAVYNSHGKYGLQSVNVQIKEVTYPLTSATPLSTTPYFDGAGSLIDPTSTSCTDGCTQDLIKLQPHPNEQRSSGFFQVYPVRGSCEAVQLTGLAKADIEVRSWDGLGAKDDSVFYSLDNDVNRTIVPLKDDDWTLIGVKTLSSVSVARSVKAACVKGSYDPLSEVKKVDGKPMTFNEDYAWGGNGSIISYSKNPSQPLYGRDRDVVPLFTDRKTLSVFQVTRSSTCKTLKFTTPVSFKLNWKLWNADNWKGGEGGETINSNNNTFTLPDDGMNDDGVAWWVLKVKAPATGQENSFVTAKCN